MKGFVQSMFFCKFFVFFWAPLLTRKRPLAIPEVWGPAGPRIALSREEDCG